MHSHSSSHFNTSVTWTSWIWDHFSVLSPFMQCIWLLIWRRQCLTTSRYINSGVVKIVRLFKLNTAQYSSSLDLPRDIGSSLRVYCNTPREHCIYGMYICGNLGYWSRLHLRIQYSVRVCTVSVWAFHLSKRKQTSYYSPLTLLRQAFNG